VQPLYGGLDRRTGCRDPAAPEGRRKVVLATPVAESSITIDGVRIVIDSGLVRQPVYEPSTGITRLETIRASRAAADQRAGRAGRTEPGIAVRLWREEQSKALPAFATPQILASDLASLVLDCIAWGVADPRELALCRPAARSGDRRGPQPPHRSRGIDTQGALTPRGSRCGAGAAATPGCHGGRRARAGPGRWPQRNWRFCSPNRGSAAMTDLDARWQRFRSDRSPRASAARALAGRLAGSGRKADSFRAARGRRIADHRLSLTASRSSGADAGVSCLPTGAVR
jgi:ATP-dependent helicase HrpB